MKNINIERLVRLKRMSEIEVGNLSQSVEINDTTSKIVDCNEIIYRRKRIEKIKKCIESKIQGIIVSVSGGKAIEDTAVYLNNDKNEELLFIDYEPIQIIARRIDEVNQQFKVTVSGSLFDLGDYETKIYDEYLDHLLRGDKAEPVYISDTEIYLSNMIKEAGLADCGFICVDNQLELFKEDKAYTIIKDINDKVQGVIKITLPNEADESLLIVCYDKTILLSDDWFHIDAE